MLVSLSQWGDAHLQNGHPPLSFVDAETGRPVRAYVSSDGELPVTRPGDIEIRAAFTLA